MRTFATPKEKTTNAVVFLCSSSNICSMVDFLRRYSKQGRLVPHLEKAWKVRGTPAKRGDRQVRRQAHRLSQRLSTEVIEAIVSEYLAGEQISAIACDRNLSEYAVSTVLHSCDVAVGLAPLSQAEIDNACELYAAGRSIAHIAEWLGRAYSSVHKALTIAGVPIRPSTRPTILTEQQLDQVKLDYQSGSSLMVIAKKHGVSGGTIRRALDRIGVPVRSAGQPRRYLPGEQLSEDRSHL